MKTHPSYRPHSIRPPFHQAFSLVEVMLSLAIASLGFITLLGLLPHGLELSRNAANLSAESRIKQKLVGELQTASWEDLTWESYGPLRYFNDQGIELHKEEVKDSASSGLGLTYIAAAQIPDQPLDLYLPTGQKERTPEQYLRRLHICIATTSNPDFDFSSAPPRLVRTFTTIIAKN